MKVRTRISEGTRTSCPPVCNRGIHWPQSGRDVRAPGAHSKSRAGNRFNAAFTLLEVMLALAIFFIATFAILDLVTQNLRALHVMNELRPTIGMVAADLSITNKLKEGFESGDFDREVYPDYSWMADIRRYGTNGMFELEIAVLRKGNLDSKMNVLLYRPESQ